jgi:RNA polymerase sigma-70 factor (ECF subfamily)
MDVVLYQSGTSCCQASESNEVMLVQRVRQREVDAMAEIFELYRQRIFVTAFRILRCPFEAEDIVQEIFTRFWVDSSRYQAGQGSLAAWLTRVAHNRAIDVLRRAGKKGPLDFDSLPSNEDQSRYTERAMQITTVNRLIEKLPEVQKAMLELAYRDELSYPEISALTGVPLGTVKTRIRNGIGTLRKAMTN